jgi:hypothetical protein
MGETGVADNSDPANIYFNPANVVGSPKVYVQGARWGVAPDLADDVWTGGGSDFTKTASLCEEDKYGFAIDWLL